MNGREEMVALINEEYKGAYRRFKPEKCCIGRCQGVSAWLLLQDHGFSLDSGTPDPNTKLPGTTYSFPHSSNPKYPFISYYHQSLFPSLHFLLALFSNQVGFDMIDAFAQSQGISMDTVHCKAFFGQGRFQSLPFPSLPFPSFLRLCFSSSVLYTFEFYIQVLGFCVFRFGWRCACFSCKAADLHEPER